MRDKTEPVEVIFHKQTEAAILVSDDGDKENAVWLPKSQIEGWDEEEDIQDGDELELVVPMWLLKKKGLAGYSE